eukprot:8756160-Lingulodinium_polyedra.AAC.1
MLKRRNAFGHIVARHFICTAMGSNARFVIPAWRNAARTDAPRARHEMVRAWRVRARRATAR